MKRLFAVIWVLLTATICWGQASPQSLQKLSAEQMADMWSHIDHAPSSRLASNARPRNTGAYLSVLQLPGTIEVTQSGQNATVTFQTIIDPPRGTAIAYRFTLPDGVTLPMQGYTKDWDGGVYAQMWNSTFPEVFPSGWLIPEVLMLTPDGNLFYVSGVVQVFSSGGLPGPLQRADVSSDGSTIMLSGDFTGNVFVRLNGMPVSINHINSPFPSTTAYTATVSTAGAGAGQMNFTICANFSCSSRVLYVNQPPPPSVPGAPPLPSGGKG